MKAISLNTPVVDVAEGLYNVITTTLAGAISIPARLVPFILPVLDEANSQFPRRCQSGTRNIRLI